MYLADISIHAPREGSDSSACSTPASRSPNFYPRSPRGERRPAAVGDQAVAGHFYPRSPRGERLGRPDRARRDVPISIHAPREGSDQLVPGLQDVIVQFLSTLPARGATFEHKVSGAATQFLSTLPARGATRFVPADCRAGRFLSTLPARGATRPRFLCGCFRFYFYPRSPRGERRSKSSSFWAGILFLSTLPARGATRCGPEAAAAQEISIHAPREGSDSAGQGGRGGPAIFLSTLPARGATG